MSSNKISNHPEVVTSQEMEDSLDITTPSRKVHIPPKMLQFLSGEGKTELKGRQLSKKQDGLLAQLVLHFQDVDDLPEELVKIVDEKRNQPGLYSKIFNNLPSRFPKNLSRQDSSSSIEGQTGTNIQALEPSATTPEVENVKRLEKLAEVIEGTEEDSEQTQIIISEESPVESGRIVLSETEARDEKRNQPGLYSKIFNNLPTRFTKNLSRQDSSSSIEGQTGTDIQALESPATTPEVENIKRLEKLAEVIEGTEEESEQTQIIISEERTVESGRIVLSKTEARDTQPKLENEPAEQQNLDNPEIVTVDDTIKPNQVSHVPALRHQPRPISDWFKRLTEDGGDIPLALGGTAIPSSFEKIEEWSAQIKESKSVKLIKNSESYMKAKSINREMNVSFERLKLTSSNLTGLFKTWISEVEAEVSESANSPAKPDIFITEQQEEAVSALRKNFSVEEIKEMVIYRWESSLHYITYRINRSVVMINKERNNMPNRLGKKNTDGSRSNFREIQHQQKKWELNMVSEMLDLLSVGIATFIRLPRKRKTQEGSDSDKTNSKRHLRRRFAEFKQKQKDLHANLLNTITEYRVFDQETMKRIKSDGPKSKLIKLAMLDRDFGDSVSFIDRLIDKIGQTYLPFTQNNREDVYELDKSITLKSATESETEDCVNTDGHKKMNPKRRLKSKRFVSKKSDKESGEPDFVEQLRRILNGQTILEK